MITQFNKLKIFSITIVIILFFNINNCFTQSMPEARNTIYFSCGLFMNMVSVGLNYERMISPNASIRTGVNLTILYSSTEDLNKDYILSFPVTANYLTTGNNKFEIGAGASPVFQVGGLERKFSPIKPAGSIGYRYQLESSSMFGKVGLDFPALPIFNLCGIGYHF
jgi:hypothetical protein